MPQDSVLTAVRAAAEYPDPYTLEEIENKIREACSSRPYIDVRSERVTVDVIEVLKQRGFEVTVERHTTNVSWRHCLKNKA